MNRKQKIALLNGILKGEKPMACVFSDWPEKTFYALPDDDEHYETEDGKIVSYKEVDHELMNYPKLRVVYQESASKEPVDEEPKARSCINM